MTALVLLPVVICAALTASIVTSRVRSASAADASARQVEQARVLLNVQTDLQRELIPSVALVITESPALRELLGLGSHQASEAGLSPALVRGLRDRTDSTIGQLAESGDASLAREANRALTSLRGDIDSGIQIPQGFDAAVRLSGELATRSTAALRSATVVRASDALVTSVRDASVISAAARSAVGELGYLAAYKFPGLGDDRTDAQARSVWLAAWGAFAAASADVGQRGSATLERQWRAALAEPRVAAYDATLTGYAVAPSRSLTASALVTLLAGNIARSNAISQLSMQTSARAITVARAESTATTRGAVWLSVLVGLGLLFSLLVAVFVRRRIARPLDALAGQAEQVSRGELVDVNPGGPREVRTVAEGLSAAVENLRRIEAQADAVASGELDSDIVREPLPGQLGEIVHRSVTTIVDAIHERDRAQSDLAHQAMHDSLTGLPNRHQALVSIGHALQRARRLGDLTGLLFVDLDLFKGVNDSFGHAAGDEVLRVCARRMREVVRDSDVVYRLGGDEFVVLLEDVSRDFPFVALAERMIARISAPIPWKDGVAQVGASIGISLCQDASIDAERLLGEADAAAYSAKSAGRGRVGVFDQALRTSLQQRAETEQAMVRALAEEQFVLHYQPVVEMGASRPIGYEALIRWQHPARGLLAPGEFIPIAEKSNLVNRIGRWTLREATAQLARWDRDSAHPAGLTVAVNISGRHLVTTDLVNDVRDALADSDVEAHRLVVEITETVLVDDPIALDNMQQLRNMGVKVAIDDFGTGYTSIGQLPKLPVDVLKIDRSFTGSELPGHHELVRLIVGAAHAFGLSVVAEGVEEARQADSLKALEVDTGQGFFYARPQPAARASELASLHVLPPAAIPSPDVVIPPANGSSPSAGEATPLDPAGA